MLARDRARTRRKQRKVRTVSDLRNRYARDGGGLRPEPPTLRSGYAERLTAQREARDATMGAQRSEARAQNQARAGAVATRAAQRGAQSAANESYISNAQKAVATKVPGGYSAYKVKHGADPLSRGPGAKPSLGSHLNNTGNSRAGRRYASFDLGNGKSAHVYYQGGKRQVIVVNPHRKKAT